MSTLPQNQPRQGAVLAVFGLRPHRQRLVMESLQNFELAELVAEQVGLYFQPGHTSIVKEKWRNNFHKINLEHLGTS